MASTVISMRLPAAEVQSLRRVARRWGRTPSETSARLVEEALRADEFTHIEFRDTGAGRQAFIKGTRLSVWMLVAVAQDYKMDITKTANHLHWAPERVRAGLNYYAAFREEIDPVLQEHSAYTLEQLTHRLPGIEVFVAGDAGHATPRSKSDVAKPSSAAATRRRRPRSS